MGNPYTHICITDVGSTTTKALLLSGKNGKLKLISHAESPTTVEAPDEDVKEGVFRAIQKLESQSGVLLSDPFSTAQNISFLENSTYLSTSSAGGGLQILVVGLTLFDSASSAKRAAYGAGGVILDTFAIDDKRTSINQMLAMKNLHPDMILLCGGTDGGAISGVIRLAEILRLAEIKPKYQSHDRIPLIFAGNQAAIPFINNTMAEHFELHIKANLRPAITEENLEPTQQEIQTLFMENVMERAPGYNDLKKKVLAPIIPTPVGVMNTLAQFSRDEDKNILMFDIGGATTDVFTYINKHFQRTVSANLGMSYSALNVLREAGVENIMTWLDSGTSEEQVRNYIANKTLNPTSCPSDAMETAIEHALAREALCLALNQHQDMHYNSRKIGFLDKLAANQRDKFEMQFSYQKDEQKFTFYKSDFDVLIGAGGIFSHCSPERAILTLIDGVQPKGVTEIWRDKDFISPHLGVLSTTEPELARDLTKSACFEPLAIHLAPHFPIRRKAYQVATLSFSDGSRQEEHHILSDSLYYFPRSRTQRTFTLNCIKKAHIHKGEMSYTFTTSLPVIINTRQGKQSRPESQNPILINPEKVSIADPVSMAPRLDIPQSEKTYTRVLELPYKGEILVSEGDRLEPDTLVGINRYEPPRLYIVNPTGDFTEVDEAFMRESLKYKVGDKIDSDELLFQVPDHLKKQYPKLGHTRFYSPVRGRLEAIDLKTSMLILSEIQDYSTSPVQINLAGRLGIAPKHIEGYLRKRVGDFVYRGEILAQYNKPRNNPTVPIIIKAPDTGRIISADRKTGIVTLHYDKQPHYYHSHVFGTVKEIVEGKSASLEFKAHLAEGKIGFGHSCHGELHYLEDILDASGSDLKDKLVFCPQNLKAKDLKYIAEKGAKAIVLRAISELELVDYLGFEPGVINTGNEIIKSAVVILDQFGNAKEPSKWEQFFKAQAGKLVYCDPHTRIRAGVIRPALYFIRS